MLGGAQTLGARLKALVNILAGVAKGSGQACTPSFADLKKDEHRGMVGSQWQSAEDRDNRRKIYRYFCPEDMTVALDNIQGIGWDGVPDHATGSELVEEEETSSVGGNSLSTGHTRIVERQQIRNALAELGGRFYQRVFSSKTRLDPATGKTTLSWLGKPPPFDFPLRLTAENEQSHVDVSLRSHRAQHKAVAWPVNTRLSKIEQRNGVRTITGEALKQPVAADLRGTAQIDPANTAQFINTDLRLGNTGAATFFMQMAVGVMGSYRDGGASAAIKLRDGKEAGIIFITPPSDEKRRQQDANGDIFRSRVTPAVDPANYAAPSMEAIMESQAGK